MTADNITVEEASQALHRLRSSFGIYNDFSHDDIFKEIMRYRAVAEQSRGKT